MNATSRVIALFGDALKALYLEDAPPEVADVILDNENCHEVRITWRLRSDQTLEGPAVAEYQEAGLFGVCLEDVLGPVAIAARLLHHYEADEWPAGLSEFDVERCWDELRYAVEDIVGGQVEPGPDPVPDEAGVWELMRLYTAMQEDPIALQGRAISWPERIDLAIRLAGFELNAPPDMPDPPVLAVRGGEIWELEIYSEDGRHWIDAINPSHCWKVTIQDAGDRVAVLNRVTQLGSRAEVRTHEDANGLVVVTVHELPGAGR